MLALLATASVMLVAGLSLLKDLLDPREHASRYLLFWFVCGWLTVTAMLLALLDLLLVRKAARGRRETLRKNLSAPRINLAASDDDR
ncbi:MAG: hypothetical protein M3Z22_00535 [Verrucomicrobiota bacterium]|nr:hypothetical protein [Verrucomicrobiota bacterium]